MSLFDDLGGEKALDAAVDLFYKKIMVDDRVNYFFEGVDMDKQARMQKGFLTFAFGGTEHYSGRSMRKAHERLVNEKGLNASHFDAVLENLAAALNELGVSEEKIKEAADIAYSVKDDVLNR